MYNNSSGISIKVKTLYTLIHVTMFNGLPGAIKELSHNTKQFKLALKNFLLLHSFYTLDEYFKYKN
jgi:hypothetical protein